MAFFFFLTFPWTLFHQPYGGRSWKTDVWLWVLASLIEDLTCCIQPFNDSLKFYFGNLSVNPECRSVFLISDKENMLKPFQQHIISEVERELMWWTLVCFILLAVSSHSLHPAHPKFRHLKQVFITRDATGWMKS